MHCLLCLSHSALTMFISVLLLWICICFFLVQFKSQRPKNFPPGPNALPFLGHALELTVANPLGYLETLRRMYGDVYSVFIGSRAAVVVSGTRALKDALVNKAVDFAGRPQDMYMNDITERRGVIYVDYCPAWKEHRRFSFITLKNFGLGKQTMEERIRGELQYTINYLEKNTGKPLGAHVIFHNIASNVMSQVLQNKRFDYDDGCNIKYVEHFITINTMIYGRWSFLYDCFHWARYFPLPFNKGFKAVQTLKSIISSEIDEHKKTRVTGEPRDYIDCYLDEMEKRSNDGTSFCPEELLMTYINLHTAGSDTASNTLLTGFLYLMTKPHLQERCHQEIDQVLGGKDFISYEDRHGMPYVQAVIHEIQRHSDTVPLGVFHKTTRDTELMGYSIPKGTTIIPNLSSALSEEGQWKFPHEFNPENFLDHKGEFVKPPDAFMPFSAGPRVCPGEALARMELFLILVTLLRKFRFIWPEDAGEPDYELVFGITAMPKPYNMKVELRGTQ